MKAFILSLVLVFLVTTNGFCKTLIKYYKNTGDIIQTNKVDEMPSQEILNDRFRSSSTDVILVDEPVDPELQRVDLNKKKLIDIPKSELDAKQAAKDAKKAEHDAAKIKLKSIKKLTGAEDLKALGDKVDEVIEVVNAFMKSHE